MGSTLILGVQVAPQEHRVAQQNPQQLHCTSGNTNKPHTTIQYMDDKLLTIRTWRGGRELDIETPEWYYKYEGDITIRTPYSTHVVYNKEAQSNHPFTQTFIQRNYLDPTVKTESDRDLETNEVSFKPFGGEQQIYEITVTEEVVEAFCDTYPPVTIVHE